MVEILLDRNLEVIFASSHKEKSIMIDNCFRFLSKQGETGNVTNRTFLTLLLRRNLDRKCYVLVIVLTSEQ